ncbi:Serine/threonine-protein phosphatase 1 [Aquimixticola soesokkakensis]|uniref:Serine/threonine-protein phosphatase 1 n=1 Tax=Aquimixticola soesokkakensis TaxID=1519096 RepID=A0A1Y5RB88_9RHOB|nr:metallophosphoesterase [Aquimixticola soesokkakensis]SLN13371.1 Serine/threonine-protein phosphatase 1 [Aquimixticola soesokkakensis]
MKLPSLFQKRRTQTSHAQDPHRQFRRLSLPNMPKLVYAVGDVHGCFNAYCDLEQKITADAAADPAPNQRLLVLLGDLVDRGPQSGALIDHLLTKPPVGFDRVCLMGNHEDMFTMFAQAPVENAQWLDFGGRETLISYGVPSDLIDASRSSNTRMKQIIAAHVPRNHLDYIANLPVSLSLPEWFFCHAGVNPDLALDQQSKDDLVWSDPAVLDQHRVANTTVVHGHTPEPQVLVLPHRICVDTGAYSTHRLSAIKLKDGAFSGTLTNSKTN